jgi:hypothetical protein
MYDEHTGRNLAFVEEVDLVLVHLVEISMPYFSYPNVDTA